MNSTATRMNEALKELCAAVEAGRISHETWLIAHTAIWESANRSGVADDMETSPE